MGKQNKLNHTLYCIITEKYCNGRTSVQTADELISAGVKIIQYREKDKGKKERYEDCLKIRELTLNAGVSFIVNDDVDIAIAVKADGVHVGQDDLPVEIVRSLVGNDMIVGVSTHCPEQALDAVAKGADYIGVGPIYSTKTKENVCGAVGFEYLDFVVDNIHIPFVAIGGIKRQNLGDVIRHGAQCISLVTEIVSAQDITDRISEIRHIIKLVNYKH